MDIGKTQPNQRNLAQRTELTSPAQDTRDR